MAVTRQRRSSPVNAGIAAAGSLLLLLLLLLLL
jgi:hypothetical protein